MDIDACRLFLHLSKSLHFTKTSKAHFMTAPTLTRVIQRLESDLGVTLFHRSNRSVQLSNAGELFQAYCEEEIQRWEQLDASLAASEGKVSGTIRLYCSVTASHQLLTELLAPIKSKYPDLNILLETGPSELSFQKIQEGSVDIALSSFPDQIPKSISTRFLKTVPLVMILPKGSDLSDLSSETLPFIFPKASLSRDAAMSWFQSQEIVPKSYPEYLGFDGALPLVSLGYAATVVPQMVLDASPLKKELCVLEPKPPIGELSIGLSSKKSKRDLKLISLFFD